ncbi:unnamed protein product [Effrenium voratum]|nr:unnamed protein product [Effrenium voratum]
MRSDPPHLPWQVWCGALHLFMHLRNMWGRKLNERVGPVAYGLRRFRGWNERWAARAEAAHQWRDYRAQQKFSRCASASALHDQRMKDFDSWRDRVTDAPRQEFEKTREWLTMRQGSQAEVDRYHKLRLG